MDQQPRASRRFSSIRGPESASFGILVVEGNELINYVLEHAFASGKDLLVGTNPLTGKITTVIRGAKLVAKRFIPYAP
jgi:hypothetical protein